MCSIIGYSGQNSASSILIKCLKRMEYRGYDSVGIATKSDNQIKLKKGTGKVYEVNSKLHFERMSGKVGIGHTRWATHGEVTDINAHPHMSNSGNIAIVHNGIIENYKELKYKLERDGYQFKSQTDSEVIANILQQNYEFTKDIKETMTKTVSVLEGHYAFVAMFEDGQLAAARFHKPLIVGLGKKSCFLSSDVLGFIEQTDDVIYIDNGNVIIVDGRKFEIMDFGGKKVDYQVTKVSKEFADAYKGDYAHFTIKEISEQPNAVIRASENKDDIKKAARLIRCANNTYITGSGTSYNSALVAKHLLSKYAKVKTEPIVSSEFPFLAETIESESVLIAVSQSGESADVLEAVSIAKKAGCKIISIVNHLTSALARESDLVISMGCGPEIGVAATKSFTSQITIMYRILQELSGKNQEIDFADIANSISKILDRQYPIRKIADAIKEISDIYVLGRGIHYPIAAEAALKLKELAYIHAEGIVGGELKHGALALMDSSVFVIVINPEDSTYSDTIINAREIKARGAKIIGISDIWSDTYDYWIRIPRAGDMAYIISEIVPVQILAYYIALEKNTDPDYPRNLAKSVTVK